MNQLVIQDYLMRLYGINLKTLYILVQIENKDTNTLLLSKGGQIMACGGKKKKKKQVKKPSEDGKKEYKKLKNYYQYYNIKYGKMQIWINFLNMHR